MLAFSSVFFFAFFSSFSFLLSFSFCLPSFLLFFFLHFFFFLFLFFFPFLFFFVPPPFFPPFFFLLLQRLWWRCWRRPGRRLGGIRRCRPLSRYRTNRSWAARSNCCPPAPWPFKPFDQRTAFLAFSLFRWRRSAEIVHFTSCGGICACRHGEFRFLGFVLFLILLLAYRVEFWFARNIHYVRATYTFAPAYPAVQSFVYPPYPSLVLPVFLYPLCGQKALRIIHFSAARKEKKENTEERKKNEHARTSWILVRQGKPCWLTKRKINGIN